MDPMNRREFVEKAALAAGVVVAGTAAVEAAALEGLPAQQQRTGRTHKIGDTIKLGRTGIRSSLLGIGTGSVGYDKASNQTRLGPVKFNALMQSAYDQGVRFFDLADQYGSMPYFREPLQRFDREKVVIQTKSNSRDPKGMRADIDRFRRELNTDYLDTLLIHCVVEPDWNVRYRGIMDVLEDYKARKIIRAHGVSCHSLEALEAASREKWVDVDLARFNPWGKAMDGRNGDPEAKRPELVKPILQKMRKDGKGVIGMKIVAEGAVMKGGDRLAKARESIRYALSTGAVDMMVIGFETPQQITEIATETRVALAEVGYQLA
jgi:aryl-alcohol dehydrogenase-like predicted oxidoreductase